ncbi:MAG: flavodoxin family protein [Clostridia bacterium]|nr:flavodoxin family protein [Clostridia bacterium]
MGKKIIILNGSPRANGNTAALAGAFTRGAQEAGNEVSCFNLQQMNIHPCLGCCKGGKDPESPCVQKDDMDKIYPSYREADVVVLASPLYYWTISGQLKCAFDRLFTVAECNVDYANPKKECVLLMAAEGNGFEETLYWYERTMNHIHWTDRGRVLCGGVFNIGDIEGNQKLDEAYELGKNI